MSTFGSDNREKILGFIREFREEHGYSPSIREIATGTGIKSTNTVHVHMKAMREVGVIRFQDGVSRSIVLVDEQDG